MSEEQLKAFLEKVKADTSLQEKLEAAADSDAVLAIAKQTGFFFSADDWNKSQTEVSDDELEAAVGGRFKVKSIINCQKDRLDTTEFKLSCRRRE